MVIVLGKAFENKVSEEDNKKFKNSYVTISSTGEVLELKKDGSYQGDRYSLRLILKS